MTANLLMLFARLPKTSSIDEEFLAAASFVT
jgi:hypothetical protein